MSDETQELKKDSNPKPPLCDFETNFRSIRYYSGQFAVDVFWGMIMSLVTPFMTDRLGASAELTSLIWMTAPFAGLITGTYVGSLVDGLGSSDSEKRTYRIRVMWGSLFLIVLLCVAFALIPIYLSPHSEWGIYSCPVATFIFFLLMVLINFYMTPYFSMKGHFGDAPVSKFVPPIWSALGYITAVMIIRYPPEFVPTDYQTLYFFACAVVLMGIFTAILAEAVKKVNLDLKKNDVEEAKKKYLDLKKNDVEEAQKNVIEEAKKNDTEGANKATDAHKTVCCDSCSFCSSLRNVCCKPWEAFHDYFGEGGLVIAAIVFFSWASLYSILPVANDWYARVICDKHPGESGYLDAVAEASNLRLYQQLAQLVASIFFAAIALCVESPEKDETDYADIDEKFRLPTLSV